MSDSAAPTARQQTAEAAVDQFRQQRGPFVVAAEKTRMAMIFTDASDPDNPIVFANDAFLALTGFARDNVLGTSFKSLMTRGIGSSELDEIEAALADRFGSQPEICYRRENGTSFWASLHISPVCDSQGKVLQHFISIVDLTDQREKQAHCETLIDELNHRVKNTLSTVQSIVSQTLRGSNDPEKIRESIESRIFALARSHELLSHRQWDGAGLHALVTAALLPFRSIGGEADRFKVEGPDVHMTPRATLALGTVFHELATNAVKHGALSDDTGTVSVTWRTEPLAGAEQLTIEWRERDGPAVVDQTQKRFGSQIIERGLPHELNGSAELAYLPTGLVCTITLRVPPKSTDA